MDVIYSAAKAYRSLEVYRDVASVWAGAVFFVQHSYTDLGAQIKSWIDEARSVLGEGFRVEHLPDCISVLEGPTIMFAKSATSVKISAFDGPSFAPAIFLSNLIEHVRAQVDGAKDRSSLTHLLNRINIELLFSTELFQTSERGQKWS